MFIMIILSIIIFVLLMIKDLFYENMRLKNYCISYLLNNIVLIYRNEDPNIWDYFIVVDTKREEF
jgi:hypothetical protein